MDTLEVNETLCEDGELPRTYGELVRRVDLTTAQGVLGLRRDMLTGETQRFIDGESFRLDL